MKSRLSLLICVVLAWAFYLGGAHAEGATGLLDGKSFSGGYTEEGQPTTPDTFVFSQGKFESTTCTRYSFLTAPYESKVTKGAISFHAVAPSAGEGKIEWTGKVQGDKLEATLVWTKQGQRTITYKAAGVLVRK